MRYIKLLIVAVILVFIFFQIYINIDELSQANILRFGTPWRLAGGVQVPLFVSLLAFMLAGFLLAMLFEVAAWYGYEKTIRSQRKQIIALKKALGIPPEEKMQKQSPAADESMPN